MSKRTEKHSPQLSNLPSDCAMVEVCDICGGVGKSDNILICPKCETSREHFYCRKFHLNKGAHDWSCDECLSTSSRKESSLKSPMQSVPLPCKGAIKSVVTRQVTNIVQANRGELIQMAGPVAPAPDNQFLQPVFSGPPRRVWTTDLRVYTRRPNCSKGHQVNGPFPLISDAEKHKPTDAELKYEGYTYVPACHSSWKGRFEIQGESFNYNISGYVALPRARSLRCVFEYSRRMPATLQFRLTPREDIWRVFFPDDCPGEDDIGLYFHSGENKRATDYNFLIKFIEDKDFVMRSDIGEVELYLFSSKLLSAGYQRLYKEYFFWGVFRKIKKHTQ